MITGESIPVDVGSGDTAYAGALVRRGEAIAEITAIGTRTYFGRAAELVRVVHVESSEQRAVLGIVRDLTIVNRDHRGDGDLRAQPSLDLLKGIVSTRLGID